MSCHYKNARKHLYVLHATIHEDIEFQHMCICVDTADYQGNTSTLFVNSIKLHLTAFKVISGSHVLFYFNSVLFI